ncbi:hypothetical protein HDU76_013864 [Blyttiomyces sp. JEL0837]|nr:hypothetical protein HDU76_013864 [Blyttiomyces sp. JEL0837]
MSSYNNNNYYDQQQQQQQYGQSHDGGYYNNNQQAMYNPQQQGGYAGGYDNSQSQGYNQQGGYDNSYSQQQAGYSQGGYQHDNYYNNQNNSNGYAAGYDNQGYDNQGYNSQQQQQQPARSQSQRSKATNNSNRSPVAPEPAGQFNNNSNYNVDDQTSLHSKNSVKSNRVQSPGVTSTAPLASMSDDNKGLGAAGSAYNSGRNNGVPSWISPTSKGARVFAEDYDKTRNKRGGAAGIFMDYLCCCIPKSKMGRIICGSVTFIIVVILAVFGALYWPRFPTIKVDAISLTSTVGGFQFAFPPDKNLNFMNISFSLNMQVSTYNPNRYNLNVDLIDLRAYLMVNSSQVALNEKPAALGIGKFIGPAPTGAPADYKPSLTPKIGSANKTLITFPAMKNTTYTMIFNVLYTPDTNVGLLADPAFQELCNVCGLTSGRRPAKISYNAVSTVQVLKSLGYAPIVNGDVYINCPASQDQITALDNAVQGGADVVDALTSIFSNGVMI